MLKFIVPFNHYRMRMSIVVIFHFCIKFHNGTQIIFARTLCHICHFSSQSQRFQSKYSVFKFFFYNLGCTFDIHINTIHYFYVPGAIVFLVSIQVLEDRSKYIGYNYIMNIGQLLLNPNLDTSLIFPLTILLF